MYVREYVGSVIADNGTGTLSVAPEEPAEHEVSVEHEVPRAVKEEEPEAEPLDGHATAHTLETIVEGQDSAEIGTENVEMTAPGTYRVRI